MPEGPLGGPRPFTESVISINVEFTGEPERLGEDAMTRDAVMNRINNEFGASAKHSDSNMKVEMVEVFPPVPDIGRVNEDGYEVQVQMKPDGRMTLEVIQEIENIIKKRMNGDHWRTAVIAV